MCGIVAIVSRNEPVPERALWRATAALRHRGPDGERTWISPSGTAGLGHTRLAINDPDGAQPISNENGDLHLVANGEFYGFTRIRTSLEADGHRFRSRSDSEIALHLYEETGTSCLERLRGQFAFTIWDEKRGVLFVARDRFGLKPLFYCEHEGKLYIASEAKALFAAGVPPAWDERGLYHALHACPHERRSLFAGVSQLPPGHCIVASDGGVRVERYWDLPPSPRLWRRRHGSSDTNETDLNKHVERVRELAGESVRLRLEADVPIGCLLSGGLDSSSVLAMATKCAGKAISAFTVSFADKRYDESVHAAQMAKAVGAEHTLVEVDDHSLADTFADAVWHAETLQYNAHGAARFLLAKGVSEAGYKSVLAGEGADEAFFGYEFLRAAANVSPNPLKRLLALLRLLRSPTRQHPGLAAVSPWLARIATAMGAHPSLFTRLTRGLGYARSVYSQEFLRNFASYDLYRSYYRHCNAVADLSKREPARQLLYLWLHSLFVNYHLAADRLDMAHGVEVRLPFLDHKLFEYVNRIPLALLARSEQDKAVLRLAMRPFLPDSVTSRPKRPFWAPPSAGDRESPLHDLVQDTLRSQHMRSVPFLNPIQILALLDRLPTLPAEDRPAADSLLLMLTSVIVLQERTLGAGV